MKIMLLFFVFLSGVMFGYGWQHYHHSLTVGNLKQIISDNQQLLDDTGRRIAKLESEISTRQRAIKVILCESSMKHDGIYSDGSKSFGWAQFQKKTFQEISLRAGYRDFKYENPYHQLLLLEWSIDNGIAERHWRDCWTKTKS